MPKAEVGTVYLLKRAELAVRGCVEVALGAVELTPSQYFILFLVRCKKATSSAELAREMGVLPQSMTELIGPLEKVGAIARRPDPANNRILRIELTAAGERLFARGTEVAIRIEQELLQGFAEKDLVSLDRLLTELIAAAEQHSFHPKLRRFRRPAAEPAAVPPVAARKPVRQRSTRARR